MDEWCRVVVGRLIYHRGRSGVDQQSGTVVVIPILLFREVRYCYFMILRYVDVGWSLKNVDVPDSRRLNPMVGKASIWSYGKRWIFGGGCFSTGGLRQ